jgi:peptide-methionine (S)-S-oxide reductase
MSTERIVLAGGCFWGMQQLLRNVDGIVSTRVGYSGGDVANATYRNHGTHAEAIELLFDPEVISFRKLLEFFFQIHDPTTRDRQGNDVGKSYRSAIFYTTLTQKGVAEETIADIGASGLWPGMVVTEVSPGRGVLAGGARAPRLPRTLSERVHVPLRAPRLETSTPRRYCLMPSILNRCPPPNTSVVGR